MRIKISAIIVAVGFLFLLFWLVNLQLIRGRDFKLLSDKNCIRLLPQEGSRGRIFDRHGNIIVDNQLSYDVMVSPQAKSSLDATLAKIASVTGTTPKVLKAAYKKNFMSSFAPVLVLKNIDIKHAIIFEELKSDYSNIVVSPRPSRFYPYGKLACHVLGYLSEIDRARLTKLEDYGYQTKDIIGFGGVEEKYDYFLRQEEGGVSVEVDHRGKVIRVLGFRPPQSGRDIQLTLDLKIQKIVEGVLGDIMGSVIIMGPNGGDIIAMASGPGFDPNWFINRTRPFVNNLFVDSKSPLVNRSISGVYPPGSVFKAMVATAGLETSKINSSSSYFCPGSARIGNRDFKCWSTHNQQDLVQALAHSCDVFFYRTGLLLGAQLIHDYAVKFGLSKPTNIDLPYEAAGFVPDPIWRKLYKFKNWYDGDTANFSIGQGELMTTPIQMTKAFAVFANNGYLVTPFIVKSIGGQEIVGAQKKSVKLPIKPQTIDLIRQGLRSAVSYQSGTANVLSQLPVAVAGKTGTVQVPHGASHAWFTGFFPFKEPKYVICVFIEHGGSGQAACILTKQIIEGMVSEGLI